jgi:Fe-S-cluster-containing hydrogenase component 2
MLVVDHVVAVDEIKCIGCKACDRVCPTGAIVTVDRIARVDQPLCTGCDKCVDACVDHGAITLLPLATARTLRTDFRTCDPVALEALCRTAQLDPDDSVCPCTGTKAREIAAAILNGAHTVEAVTLQTGVRGACSIWCSSPTVRLLEIAGFPPAIEEKDWRLYPDGVDPKMSLSGISEEIAARYPEYHLVENRQILATEGRVDLPFFPSIMRETK